MPFTFSHPAIVLPLFRNKKISVTGLFIGSMAPDFEFFFRMRTQSEISHTFLGLLVLDLPLAIIVTIVFHGVLKKAIISNSPYFIQHRLLSLKDFNWFAYFTRNSGVVMVSFFIGAFSHFFLDSLSHWDGFVVQQFAFLSKPLCSFPIYDWIQYGSSVLGLLVLGIYFFKLPADKNHYDTISIRFWLVALFLATIIIYLRFTTVVGWNRIADMIIGVISSITVALTISSIIDRKSKKI